MADDKTPGKIGILGAGWLGFSLAQHLLACGFSVCASSRSPETLARLTKLGAEAVRIDLPDHLPANFPAGLRHLIVTLPPGGRRHGAATRSIYLAQLSALAARVAKHPNLRLLFCSSTGVYGSVEGPVTERTAVAPDTHSARAIVAAEELLRGLPNPLTILRLAGLAGPDRHPGRFYGGRDVPIRDAGAPVNLVHRADVISAIELLVHRPGITGTYNVCAAAHPEKGKFYRAAAAALKLDVGASVVGGSTGKLVDSSALRKIGWQPIYDDLQVFFRP